MTDRSFDIEAIRERLEREKRNTSPFSSPTHYLIDVSALLAEVERLNCLLDMGMPCGYMDCPLFGNKEEDCNE